jgi:hypothetical protein
MITLQLPRFTPPGTLRMASTSPVQVPTAYLVRANPANGGDFQAATVWSPGQDPAFYDGLSYGEVASSLLPEDWLVATADLTGDSLLLSPTPQVQSRLRVSGQYYVEQLSVANADVLPVLCVYSAMKD